MNFLIFCHKIYLILTNCCRNSINKLSNHILYYYIGPILQNWDLKLVEDIFGQCNNDIDCPKGLICEKNACAKPGPVPIGIICIHTEFSNKYILLLTNWSDNTMVNSVDLCSKIRSRKIFFGWTFTEFQTVCKKKPKSGFKSQFQSQDLSKSFRFFFLYYYF